MDEQEKNRVYVRKIKPSFTREQRAGFILVIGAGVVAMLLGLIYVGQHLANPFSIDYVGPAYVTTEEEQLLEILDQQQSDTDGDTLSDYDELYIYRTSPYLADTDGDGYDDFTEINTDSDPNCAAGEDCETEDDIVDIDSEIDFGVTTGVDDNIEKSAEAISQIESVISNLSVDDIRQLLIDSGAEAEQVDLMTDEEVQTLFDAVISELTSSGELDNLIEGSLE